MMMTSIVVAALEYLLYVGVNTSNDASSLTLNERNSFL